MMQFLLTKSYPRLTDITDSTNCDFKAYFLLIFLSVLLKEKEIESVTTFYKELVINIIEKRKKCEKNFNLIEEKEKFVA